MNNNLFYSAMILLVFISSSASAVPNFVVPGWCSTYGVTDAPSDETATDGDEPVVEVYFTPEDDSGEIAITNIKIYATADNVWLVQFEAPYEGHYNINTSYTAFLTTYQSYQVLEKGITGIIPLSLPGSDNNTTHLPRLIINVKNGQITYPKSFIEFLPDYNGADPFTMQADENGQAIVFCIDMNFAIYVTVYDSNHVYVGSGLLGEDGTIHFFE
ncbi:hypothetical protein [Pectobacterium polaris]|uniref:hypothetical protein n=1 Tax=Pectobacterium polaris TaxID=2042057 RepID=UPI001F24A9CE|nr:hypothetical protein [Pectobacterium polaris]